MTETRNERRLRVIVVTAALTFAALSGTAGATPKGIDGEHKVTICHVTNSETNPWVQITVDVAAFDGEGQHDHTHHVSKDGRVDYILLDGECGDGGGTDTDGGGTDQD